MYVESDYRNRIIIQDITQIEASFICECIDSYLSGSSEYISTRDTFLLILQQQLESNTNG